MVKVMDMFKEFPVLQQLWNFSDGFPKDSFRFWLSHVFYNLAKDLCYLVKVRRW